LKKSRNPLEKLKLNAGPNAQLTKLNWTDRLQHLLKLLGLKIFADSSLRLLVTTIKNALKMITNESTNTRIWFDWKMGDKGAEPSVKISEVVATARPRRGVGALFC